MYTLLLQFRNNGKDETVEIEYAPDMRAEFDTDVAHWTAQLDAERHGRIRGDAPILKDLLAIC